MGQYEKLIGRAFGEVDPNDPRNEVIADIALAPRNLRGMVEYSMDIYILRPVDRSAGNHRVFFEINNRGNNFSFGLLNNARVVLNDPTTAADAGNGFLMRQGYTIVLSGWDAGVAPGGGRQTITVPIFEANSANEYWVKSGSLLHTDTFGNDLKDPRNVRFYLFSSLPHSPGRGPTGPGICQQPRNPVVANPGLRALLVALDEWASSGRKPPASRVPRRADKTLVPSLPQDKQDDDHGVGFPHIPGVTFNGLMTTGDVFDYGPFFDAGILTVLPPAFLGSPYPAFVPRTDRDGNDIAGIRLPEIAVPLATYTGWGLRAAAFAGDDLCDAAGQKIDFLQTKAERRAVGDPRRSIEERYPSHEKYVREVARAAIRLYRQGLLLEEDVQRYVQAAEASDIGK